jgi:hypothetical protein
VAAAAAAGRHLVCCAWWLQPQSKVASGGVHCRECAAMLLLVWMPCCVICMAGGTASKEVGYATAFVACFKGIRPSCHALSGMYLAAALPGRQLCMFCVCTVRCVQEGWGGSMVGLYGSSWCVGHT